MNRGRSGITILAIGLTLAAIGALLVFGVPLWAANLQSRGVKANDLSPTSQFTIDLSNVLQYYWAFWVWFPLALIVTGVAVTIRGHAPKGQSPLEPSSQEADS